MMCAAAALTREWGVHTFASLSPIMVDGTGMCGGCRVAVGGKVRLACVDGPGFDAHEVDFDETRAAQPCLCGRGAPRSRTDRLNEAKTGLASGPILGLDHELVLWDRGSSACLVWSASSRVAAAGKEPASVPRTTSGSHAAGVLCPWVLLAYIRFHSTPFQDCRTLIPIPWIADLARRETFPLF